MSAAEAAWTCALIGAAGIAVSAAVTAAVGRFRREQAARAERRERMLRRLNLGFERKRCDCEACTVPTETNDAFHLALWETEMAA